MSHCQWCVEPHSPMKTIQIVHSRSPFEIQCGIPFGCIIRLRTRSHVMALHVSMLTQCSLVKFMYNIHKQGHRRKWLTKKYHLSNTCPFLNLNMGKHSRKRQKVENSAQELVQPLGTRVSLSDDATKDDEERRLESLLFGVPFVPRSGNDNKNTLVVSDGEDERDGLEGGKELQNMLDTDVSGYNIHYLAFLP